MSLKQKPVDGSSQIELPDGPVIASRSTFTRADGTTGTVGDMILQAEALGQRVEQVETGDDGEEGCVFRLQNHILPLHPVACSGGLKRAA